MPSTADFKDLLDVPDHSAGDIMVALEKSNPTGINQYSHGGGTFKERLGAWTKARNEYDQAVDDHRKHGNTIAGAHYAKRLKDAEAAFEAAHAALKPKKA